MAKAALCGGGQRPLTGMKSYATSCLYSTYTQWCGGNSLQSCLENAVSTSWKMTSSLIRPFQSMGPCETNDSLRCVLRGSSVSLKPLFSAIVGVESAVSRRYIAFSLSSLIALTRTERRYLSGGFLRIGVTMIEVTWTPCRMPCWSTPFFTSFARLTTSSIVLGVCIAAPFNRQRSVDLSQKERSSAYILQQKCYKVNN